MRSLNVDFSLAGAEGLSGAAHPLLRYPKKDSGFRFSSLFSTAAPSPAPSPRHRRRSQALPGTLRVPRILVFSAQNTKSRRFRVDFLFGRGRRARTLGTRFWRPLLYQLSYAPIFICIRVEKWWALGDSNPGPSGYEPDALTN